MRLLELPVFRMLLGASSRIKWSDCRHVHAQECIYGINMIYIYIYSRLYSSIHLYTMFNKVTQFDSRLRRHRIMNLSPRLVTLKLVLFFFFLTKVVLFTRVELGDSHKTTSLHKTRCFTKSASQLWQVLFCGNFRCPRQLQCKGRLMLLKPKMGVPIRCTSCFG